MTIEEKRQAIENYCRSKRLCTVGQDCPCPLYGMGGDCYKGVSDIGIEKRFKLVSYMPDYKGPKETEAAPEKETVNHPAHYQGKHECIDEMIALFGVEAVKHFCMCNVYKYRFRAANKNGQEDLDKADWYMDKLMELEEQHD